MKKRVTAADVAQLAGVSRTTVSFVLNGTANKRISQTTRARVIETSQQLGYLPDSNARRVAFGRTNVMGLVVRQNSEQVLADRFLAHILNGLNHAAAAHNYHVLLEMTGAEGNHTVYTHLIGERYVDGLVIFGPMGDDEDLLRAHVAGAPIVLIGQLPDMPIPFVDIDNVESAAKAVHHLIELGHRRIGLITNGPLSHAGSALRLQGYRQALEDAGLNYDESLVKYGDLTPHGGARAMAALLEARPTAVFVASDTVAFGAMQMVRQNGLSIPEDIALVGFDDVPLARFASPPLTTVRVPASALGRAAGDLLARLIAGNGAADCSSILLETELVVRQSSVFS
ncbi:MAG: LacI family DNA-binding transcriptional regulator [Anaerolineae bacterium]|nr:LacI family DNA-binding transcriptional regulator [Anaerolineae bacterium]